MTDRIIIAIPKYVEPGTYEYKTIVHKAKDGKLLIETGTLISKSSAVVTDPAVGGEKAEISLIGICISIGVVFLLLVALHSVLVGRR